MKGPLKSLKWAGMPLNPEGEPEVELGGTDYEANITGNGHVYPAATPKVGHLKTDVIMTGDEYKAVKKMQDGKPRAGSATMQDGKVLSLDCMLTGEIPLSDSKVSLTLSGGVRFQ